MTEEPAIEQPQKKRGRPQTNKPVAFVEPIKRARGRPKQERPPTEPNRIGRPSTIITQPNEQKKRGRPINYEDGTIQQPKSYYQNKIIPKTEQNRFETLPTLGC